MQLVLERFQCSSLDILGGREEANCFNKRKPYGECTAFQAEFYFWPEIQIHIAVDELFGQQVARDQVLSLLDDSLDNYKKTYQDEKAIVNCIEKYKGSRIVLQLPIYNSIIF